MRTRPARSVAANPVLIGAATVLITIVAVFLAYNANNGLPFVPTYDVTAEVPNAALLVKNNEVRIGGARVGVVDKISTRKYRDGRVTALLHMKLQRSIEPIARDSTIIIRPRSALGLKYVQLTPGNPRRSGTVPNGGSLPLANARPHPVEFDDFFNTFDAKTRRASQRNLVAFGSILAGRGTDLNIAIQQFGPLLDRLIPVAGNLADRRTELGRFVSSLARSAAEVAPAAEAQAQMFANQATTWAALNRVRTFVQQTISEGPATLDQSIRSFRIQRPFLVNSAGFFTDLQPGAHALGQSAPTLASALSAGIRVLPRTPPLNERLAVTAQHLQAFSEDQMARLGIRDLTRAVRTLAPTLAFLTPAQTVCNYPALFFRNAQSLLSEGGRTGTWQRVITFLPPEPTAFNTNTEGQPSTGPAKNGNDTAGGSLHFNPYPNAAGPGQPRECEAGNEPTTLGGQLIGNVPGNQGTRTDRRQH